MIDYSDASDLFYRLAQAGSGHHAPVVLPSRPTQTACRRRPRRSSSSGRRDSRATITAHASYYDTMHRAGVRRGPPGRPRRRRRHDRVRARRPRGLAPAARCHHARGLVLTGSWPAKTESGGSAGSANIVTTLTMSCRPAPPSRPVGRANLVEAEVRQRGQGPHPDVGRCRARADRPAHGIGRTGDGGRRSLRAGARPPRRSRRPRPLSRRRAAGRRGSRRDPDRPSAAGDLRRPDALRAVVGAALPPVRRTEIRGAVAGAGRRPVDATSSRASFEEADKGVRLGIAKDWKGTIDRDLVDDRRRDGDGEGVAGRPRRCRGGLGGDADGTRRTTTSGRRSGTCRRCCPKPTPTPWPGRRSCAAGAASAT